jgi:hypothetical protein
MSYTTAAFPDVTAFDSRVFAIGDHRRAIFRGIAACLGAVGAGGLIAGVLTISIAWVIAASLTAHLLPSAPISEKIAFAGRYGPTAGTVQMLAAAPLPSQLAPAPNVMLEARLTATVTTTALPANPPPETQAGERADSVPLPTRRPADAPRQEKREIALAPASPAAPKEAHNKSSIAIPAADVRTAIYDIAAHTVYMPNGERLEAHSGLGPRLDNPRYVSAKNRGPTPPNVYQLSLREQLFHGVRAIRLTPADDAKMFGRDGMLAHTYMLGPSGQSFGCVSFKHYQQFLQAYLRGEVDRMVVVPHLPTKTARSAELRTSIFRFAFNSPRQN